MFRQQAATSRQPRHRTYLRPRLIRGMQAHHRLRSRPRLQQEGTRRRLRQYDVICMENEEDSSESPAPRREVTLIELLLASLL